MTTTTMNTQIRLTLTNCYTCGTTWGQGEQFDIDRREDHRSFYCPNGHSQQYTGKTEAQKLREKVAAKEEQLEMARRSAQREREAKLAAERSAAAYKGQVTKIRKKISEGLCPCCEKNFPDLTNHMQTEHPDYTSIDV